MNERNSHDERVCLCCATSDPEPNAFNSELPPAPDALEPVNLDPTERNVIRQRLIQMYRQING